MRGVERPGAGDGFSRGTLIALLVVAGLRIWLTLGHPLTVIWDSDERTFLLQARGLLAGNWLGDYTIVTLVKNPFYGMFLAGSFVVGIPTLLAQQLAYVAACALFLVAVRPALAAWRPYQLILLYALLVFNPMSALGSPRLLRNHLYASLALLLLACSVAVVLRAGRSLATIVTWSVAGGVFLSALWLTREESLWVAPFLAVFTAVSAWRLVQAQPGRWLRHLVVLGVPYALLALSIFTVSLLNQRYYGIFTTNEIQGPGFLNAFAAMYRVVPRTPRRTYVVAPKEIRQQLYAVSPAFAELADALEGRLAVPWTTLSCRQNRVCTDNDVVWWAFQWQLREAAAQRGHHDSAVHALRFYTRVADEINAACASGRLQCIGKRASLLPPWAATFVWSLPGSFARALLPLVTFRGLYLGSRPSVGPEVRLAEFREVTREEVAPPQSDRFSVTGWALSRHGTVELSVRSGAGDLIESTYRAVPRPDVAEYVKKLGLDIPRAAEAGFDVASGCRSPCFLWARTAGAEWIATLPLDGSVKRFQSTPAAELARAAGKDPDRLALERGDVLLYVNGFERAGDRFEALLTARKTRILRAIGAVYQVMVPILSGAALLLFLAHLALSWRHRALALADLAAVLVLAMLCSRTAALAFVDVAAIRLATVPEYAMVGYPLVLLFCGLLVLHPRVRVARPTADPEATPAR